MNKFFSGILAAVLFVACLPISTARADSLSEINEYKAQIAGLIDDCTALGIPTDYEQAALAIIEAYSKEQAESPIFKEYVLDELERVCERTVSDLTAYLTGEKQAFSAPTLEGDKLSLNGQSFFGTVSEDGVKSQKPVFLNGVGHWNQVRKDLDFFEKIGLNHIQTEVRMADVILEPTAADNWKVYRNLSDKTKMSRSTNEFCIGSNSICITRDDNTWVHNMYTRIYQRIEVEPSTKYNYTFYVKRKNAQNFWFSLKGKSRAEGAWVDLSTSGEDNGWKSYSGSYTTGENETELELSFLNEDGAEYIYLDAVMLIDTGTKKNLVRNFSFENLTDTGFQVEEKVIEEVRSFLLDAAEHNIKVDLSLAPHYSPSFLEGLYDDKLKYSGWGFFNYDPLMETSRKFIKKYVESLCEAIKDCTALNSICLTNEPSFLACYEPERYDPLWRSWLIEKYGIIDNLNAAYQSGYNDFEELSLSQMKDIGMCNSKDPMFTDYKQFNEELFTDWHAWLASIVKEIIPSVYVHTKAMSYLRMDDVVYDGGRGQILNGANHELFSTFSDLNGCDNGGSLKDKHSQFLHDMHYDMFESIKTAPIIDSENHIVNETSHEAAQYVYSATWQGAVHGLGASAVWTWDKNYGYAKSDGFFHQLLTLKPEHMWQLSRVTMDMNRLSEELTAIQNAKPEVGILYSEIARLYSFTYMNSVYETYKSVSSTGEKVHIITDTGDKSFDGLKLIVVPNAVCVTDEVFNALKNFDGKLLIIGKNSLSRTENDQERDPDEVAEVLSRAEVIPCIASGYNMASPTTDEIEAFVDRYVKGFGRDVSVTEEETQDVPSDISWMAATHHGKKLVNICNYGVKPVKLRVTGAKGWKNLITGEKLSNVIVAEPQTPMLLEETTEYILKTPISGNTFASKLMPNTPILKYNDGYKVSWVNPDNNHISKISLYAVESDFNETLVYDGFLRVANYICYYSMDTSYDDTLYFKIVMEFDNAPSSEFILRGEMPKYAGDGWTHTVSSNDASAEKLAWQYEIGLTDTDVHSGKYALRVNSNYEQGDRRIFINSKPHELVEEEGKNYRISFWMKSDNVSGMMIYPSILRSKMLVPKLSDNNYFSETRNDWKYYYYERTGERTLTSYGISIQFLEMVNSAIIDDISIYELGENGEPIGENMFSIGDFEDHVAVDCGEITNLQIIKGDGESAVTWDEPDNDAFAAVNLYINGQLSGKLTRGCHTIYLSLEEEDVVEIRPVDVYGIEGNGREVIYSTHPVSIMQNGDYMSTLKAGETYDVVSEPSAELTDGRIYTAFYGEGGTLLSVASGEEQFTLTVPDDSGITHLKTFIWDEGLRPLCSGRTWIIR